MLPPPRRVKDLTNAFLGEVDNRLPGRLSRLFLHGSSCWGEFFEASDVDFVAVWDVLPSAADLGSSRTARDNIRKSRGQQW